MYRASAEVAGVLPDDGGDGGDEGFSSADARVHASVVGGCGEFGCCHGVPHSRVVVSAAGFVLLVGTNTGGHNKTPVPETGGYLVRDTGFEPVTSSV